MVQRLFGLFLCLCFSSTLFADEALQVERERNVRRIMDDLNTGHQDVSMIAEVYAPGARFIDPLVGEEGLVGIQAISDYHHQFNDMIDSMDIEILDYAISGDSHIISWKGQISMTVTIDLAKELGKLSQVLPFIKGRFSFQLDRMEYVGASIFRFHPGESKVATHLDIYNEMDMYTKMPSIGPILKAVKAASRKNMLQSMGS